MTEQTRPDPLAYGPTGYRCGCGKDAHSNLVPCQPESLPLDEIEARAAGLYEYATGLDAAWQAEADQLAGTDVPALLVEVRALRSERDDLRGKFAEAAASLAEQVQRYGQRQREHNADREELEQLRTALTQIRHLHKDSPMGPCPVCVDADAVAAGGDGLVPYPCPTGRLAGAKDCDPPSFRPAAAAAGESGSTR